MISIVTKEWHVANSGQMGLDAVCEQINMVTGTGKFGFERSLDQSDAKLGSLKSSCATQRKRPHKLVTCRRSGRSNNNSMRYMRERT